MGTTLTKSLILRDPDQGQAIEVLNDARCVTPEPKAKTLLAIGGVSHEGSAALEALADAFPKAVTNDARDATYKDPGPGLEEPAGEVSPQANRRPLNDDYDHGSGLAVFFIGVVDATLHDGRAIAPKAARLSIIGAV